MKVCASSCTPPHCISLMSPRTAERNSSIRTSPARSISSKRPMTAGVGSFVYTSTTSVFGDALAPPAGKPCHMGDRTGHADPEEHLRRDQGSGRGPVPARSRGTRGLPASCSGRHASSPRQDDDKAVRLAWTDDNAKVNEFLFPARGSRGCRDSPSAGRRTCAGTRVPAIHHQRNDTLFTGGPAAAACGCSRGDPVTRPGLPVGVRAPRLEDVPGHRSRLCQRTGSS